MQYREQRRKDPAMSPVAEKLSDAEIRELAAHYAALPPFASRRDGDPARVTLAPRRRGRGGVHL
ncbi:MAG: c-type cytochrome [Myxococcales bacterium]